MVRLLSDIEVALGENNVTDFVRLTSAALPQAELAGFVNSSFATGQTSAAVRERDRRPEGTEYQLLVEILIDRSGAGRIATWQLQVQPSADEPDRFEIVSASPIASVEGLVQLQLDTTKQYAPRDLVFTALGMTVEFDSGAVFLAHVDAGATALVFRGRGTLRFAPDDPAEQVQIRAFSGKPILETSIDSAFIRVSPSDLANHLAMSRLELVDTNPGDVARARAIFDDFATKSYTLNLGDLATARWSLLPPFGDVLAELDTSRFGILTYLRSTGDAEDVSLFDRAQGRNISVYASEDRLASRGRYYSEDDSAAYDVLHYDVDVRIDPEREWLNGRGSLRLKTRRDGMTTLSIKLAESFAISSVSSPTLGRVLALRVSGQSSVLVSLNRPLPRDSELQLDIYYSGRLQSQNVEREAFVLSADAPQQQDPFASLDRLILPEPRYLYSNRSYWYPQAPITDFATASLQLRVPAQYQVVASGSLASSVVTPVEEQSGRGGDERAERVVRFMADRPLRYLACVVSRFVPVGQAEAAVPAVAASPDARGVNVDVVATPRLQRSSRPLPERTAEILSFYGSEIGEAPYPDFSLATLDAELPSGHSPAYFALWNQATLPTSLSWRDDPVSLNGHPYFFLAHEVAHQWWGQAIGWANYHEQWLSEGLSQFFAAAYAGHDRGPDTERELIIQMRDSALRLSRHGPVHMGYRLGHVQGDGRIFRGLVYNKSAVVVHMLRRLIGAEAFGRGIRRFYAANRFQKAGTDDFRKAFEAETPQPLDRFFERWIHGFSIPEVRLSWRMANPARLAVQIEQLGETFDFPLTLTIQYADGREEQVTVAVTTPAHESFIPVGAPVRRVDARDDTGLVIVKR